MGELTIRGTRAERNLMEWIRRVAECRSSGLPVTRWCTEHDIKPKTYYNWQKKVFAAMIEQQRQQIEEPQEPERRFAELAAPVVQNDLIASVRLGAASLEVYSGATAGAGRICGASGVTPCRRARPRRRVNRQSATTM